MSPLGDSGLFSVVDERPKLDADSFQKLLAAAWAIQCQHDAERQVELPEQSSRIAIPDGFFDPVINTADFDFLREPVGEDSAVKPTVAGVKIPPKSVHAATETAGALALATDRRVQAAPSKQQLPIALKVVNINHQHTATVYTIRKRDFRLALTAGAAVLLIAVIAAVWGFRVARGRKDFAQPAPSAVSASQQNSSDQRNPLVETSHLRATDSNVVAALEELSSYEINLSDVRPCLATIMRPYCLVCLMKPERVCVATAPKPHTGSEFQQKTAMLPRNTILACVTWTAMAFLWTKLPRSGG